MCEACGQMRPMKSLDLQELEEALAKADTLLSREGDGGTKVNEFHVQVRQMLHAVTAERLRAQQRERETRKPWR